MTPITKQQFDDALAKDSYWKGRWWYYEKTIWIARQFKAKTVLELGANSLPVFADSDVMGLGKSPSIKFKRDACKLPWDEIGQYDLFIALQVFEHLKGKQREVFEEVKRHCKHAILSIPYQWRNSIEGHNGLDDKTLLAWTMRMPTHRFLQGHPKRLLWGIRNLQS